MKTLIKGGTLVTAEKTFPADILVEDEKISQIGQNLQSGDAKKVDATFWKNIMPKQQLRAAQRKIEPPSRPKLKFTLFSSAPQPRHGGSRWSHGR